MQQRPNTTIDHPDSRVGSNVDFTRSSISVPRTALHSDCALAPRSWGPRGPFTPVAHLCAHESCALHSSTAARRALPRARRGRAAQRGRHGVGPRRRAGGAEPIRAPRARPTMPRGRRSQIIGARPSTSRLPAHAVASTPVIAHVEKARNTPSEATGRCRVTHSAAQRLLGGAASASGAVSICTRWRPLCT